MRRRMNGWWRFLGATTLLSMGLPAPMLAIQASTPESSDSARSRVVVERVCWNMLDRTVVTLFANGTVRRKHNGGERPELWLGELEPDQLTAFLARLREPQLDESGGGAEIRPQGDWIEHCELDLRIDGRKPWRFTYGRYDSLPLAVTQLMRVIEDLWLEADQQVGMSRLPDHYAPKPGDLLRRRDGVIFRIVGFTVDKRAVELSGSVVPLTLFVAIADLPKEFDALVGTEYR